MPYYRVTATERVAVSHTYEADSADDAVRMMSSWANEQAGAGRVFEGGFVVETLPDYAGPMSVDVMLSNAAVASQHRPLVDDAALRGAVLRSVAQWLESRATDGDAYSGKLVSLLRDHEDFDL